MYISVFYFFYFYRYHFTWVAGSVTFRGAYTCLHEFLRWAGEVQISTRWALLFSRARSSDPLAATGARYQNSRQASPSSPSGPLSKIWTETSSREKMQYVRCWLSTRSRGTSAAIKSKLSARTTADCKRLLACVACIKAWIQICGPLIQIPSKRGGPKYAAC